MVCWVFFMRLVFCFFFFKQKTAYEIGLGIPAEPLFRSRKSRNVTLIILTLSVSRLLNLLLRLVAFLLFLNPQCLASISRWRSEERRVGKECRSGWWP